MAKKKISLFECQHCGEQSTKWLGKCPNCGSWDSFIELNQEQQEVLKNSSKIINTTSKAFAAESLPEITAEAAITVDLKTGEVIYCKDADSKRYPASTTKLLTGLLLAENKSKNDMLEFTKSAKAQPEYSLNINYMKNGMKVGDKISADDIMKGLTYKAFNTDYHSSKQLLYKYLGDLSEQIKADIF